MPKKPRTSEPDPQLADAARISPQQIWQAGLGAFLKAQKDGDRQFNQLVSQGSELQARTRAQDSDPDDPDAPSSWHKLEQIFEDRVARALAAMAVPTHHDMEALREQVEALSRTVEALTAKPAPAKKAAAKKPAPRKKAA
jgi:polyhydroxyalkanoate synthesis regulator phasin